MPRMIAARRQAVSSAVARFLAAAPLVLSLAAHAQIPPSPSEIAAYTGLFAAAQSGDCFNPARRPTEDQHAHFSHFQP